VSCKPFAPATERNRTPILGVLRHEFRDVTSVLEIGSGTGQHAVYFGPELRHLTWQTSELEEHHAGIRAWLDEAKLPNLRYPLVLDVVTAELPAAGYDAVFSANTTHIMSFAAVERMFRLVSRVLRHGGVFCLYGPFRQHGGYSTQSNAEFDKSLQLRDPRMGLRHLEDLDRLANKGGMRRCRLYALPANNLLAVWGKSEQWGTP
jgi:SAM-dependent methyltransferase